MISPIQKNKIKKSIIDKFNKIFQNNSIDLLKKSKKSDNTIVTEIDIFVSNLIKEELHKSSKFSFFSEEDHGELKYPSIILDPIDGTRELAKGLPECALSLAFMEDPSVSKGWGWIFNPFTGFDISSDNEFFISPNYKSEPLVGFVSRSEWEGGLFNNDESVSSIRFIPRGSIAFKLGLLACGACDFVLTKKPKNIWDIAAGTILCEKKGHYLFHKGKKVSLLDKSRFDGPLYWCREEHSSKIKDFFNFQ
ncbi:hypothetical protein OAK75_11325 [Bacteriovoracales bacterium]|nr:hypothetical protein [Bacteriovoracales bacterium]